MLKNNNVSTEEDRDYCVYIHTNKINGKKYVGQTCKKPEIRWLKDGNGYKNQPYFYSAIKKYGWDNFEHEIIKSNLSSKEANDLETDLIRKLDSMNPSKGYNLVEGGAGGRRSEIVRKKLSKSKTGTHHSEDTKNKISKSSTGQHNGIKNSNAISVAQYDKQGNLIKIWDYMKLASEKLNINYGSISRCCCGEYKTAGGFIWKYTDDNLVRKQNRNNSNQYVPVIQISNDGSIIARYNSMAQASLATGCHRQSISDCCRGKIKTSGGYIWKYAEIEN
jgi:group I intron endonuclease